jgi:O-antigen/teichoic acid export membrane protein
LVYRAAFTFEHQMISGLPTAAAERRRIGLLLAAWNSDLVRKISASYAVQLLSVTLNLITTVILARSLGPQGRGLYAVALALGNLGIQIGNLGLHSANTIHVARERQLLAKLLSNAVAAGFGLGGLIAVLVWVISSQFLASALLPPNLLLLSLLWIPVGLTFLLVQNLLLGVQEIRIYNIGEALNKILALTLVGAAILANLGRVEFVFAASLLSVVVSLLWAISRANGLIVGWVKPSWELLGRTLEVGFKAYVICLLSFLVLRIDLLMVKYMLGAEQAGYYSVAASMADVCLILPVVAGAILFPRLAAMNDGRLRMSLMRKAVFGTALCLLPILALISLAAAPAVQFLFGRVFLPSAVAFVWLVPGVLALGLETVMVQYLNSFGFPKSIIAVWAVTAVFNILANLWAIPQFGIVGASAVSSLSYALAFLLVLWVVRRTPVPAAA